MRYHRSEYDSVPSYDLTTQKRRFISSNILSISSSRLVTGVIRRDKVRAFEQFLWRMCKVFASLERSKIKLRPLSGKSVYAHARLRRRARSVRCKLAISARHRHRKCAAKEERISDGTKYSGSGGKVRLHPLLLRRSIGTESEQDLSGVRQ